MNKENSKALKGILQVIIIIHHISQLSHNSVFLSKFTYFGVYSVGVFFFLSIYGMLKQLENNKKKYLKWFLKHRFTKILIPVIIFSLISYIIRVTLFKQTFTFKKLFDYYKAGNSLIFSGWFLNSILIIYLIFFFTYAIVRINKKYTYIYKSIPALFFIMNIYIYLLFLMRLGVGDWWYNSLGLVVIGVIYADFEKYINWLFDHFYYILLGVFYFVISFYSHIQKTNNESC